MKLLQTKPFGEAEEARVSAGSKTRPLVIVGARRAESKNRLRFTRKKGLYFMLSVFGGDSDQKKPKPRFPCTVLWLRIPRVTLEMCQFGWK